MFGGIVDQLAEITSTAIRCATLQRRWFSVCRADLLESWKKKLSSTTCCKVCTSIVPKESSFVCRQLKGWKSEEEKSDFSEERKVLLCWWKIRSPPVTMESNPFCKRSFVLVSHTAACASCAGVGARVSCVKDFSAFFLGKLSSVGYECSNNSDRRRTFIVSIFSTKKTP